MRKRRGTEASPQWGPFADPTIAAGVANARWSQGFVQTRPLRTPIPAITGTSSMTYRGS